MRKWRILAQRNSGIINLISSLLLLFTTVTLIGGWKDSNNNLMAAFGRTQDSVILLSKVQFDALKRSETLIGENEVKREKEAMMYIAQTHFRVAYEEARRGRKDAARSQLLDGVQLILGDQISCTSINNIFFTFDNKEWMDTLVPLFQDSYLQVIVAGFNKPDPPILVGLRDCGPKA